MKKNKFLILFSILLFNFLFLSFAKANDKTDTIIDSLGSVRDKLDLSSKSGQQVAFNIDSTIILIDDALENSGNFCSGSLSLAVSQITNEISSINARTCKSKKSLKKGKCIPKELSSEVQSELENTSNLLFDISNTDENFDGIADICEEDEDLVPPSSPTPSILPQNQEVGTCSINQQVPPIEDLPLETQSVFTNNLGSLNIYRYLDDDGAIFKMQNTTLIPIEVMVELKPGSLNITPTIPEIISIDAMSSKTAFKICPSSDATWDYTGYTFSSKLGSSSIIHTGDGKYILPFPPGMAYIVIQGETGTFSHFDNGLYSIDFEMPEGSNITAMRDGTVLAIKEDSNEGGPDKEVYASKGNYVWIVHEDNSLSYYYHLKQNGALVEPGMKVKAGDIIGLSGNTGYTTTPHLHVQVTLPKGFLGIFPVQIRFKGIDGALQENISYTGN